MVVQHNLASMNAHRNLGVSTGSIKKSTEKLSSGYKINRAADDAAGLTISEKMRSQIRGLTQASDNSQDGVSFCQIADGALDEVHDMLKRCQELSVQAANATNTDADRGALQKEIDAISSEIDRIHESALFNERRVFPDAGHRPDTEMAVDSLGAPAKITKQIVVGSTTVTLELIDSTGGSATIGEARSTDGTANPDNIKNSPMAQFVVEAASSAVEKIHSLYPDLFNKASSDGIKIGLELKNQAPGGTLATASLNISSNGMGTVTSYKLWIDTADYPMDSYESKKANLASTIAHEMTHVVMYDTLTTGMLNSFPDWFVEGMAQTSSGDDGWFSGELNSSSSDDKIKAYKGGVVTDPYGAGYAACMYLGQVVGEKLGFGSTVESGTIAKGLNALLAKVADNIAANNAAGTSSNIGILDSAIKELTGNKFSSTDDFVNHFSSEGDAESLQFIKNFITARGTNGAGSLLGELNASESSLFASPSSSGSYSNYQVQKDSMWYSNGFGTGFVWPENLPSTGGGGGIGNDENGLTLQVGAANKKEQQIFVKQFNISGESLFDNRRMDVSTIEGARATIAIAQKADAKISAVRSYYGAVQNRLEHTILNLDNVVENTTAAESRIRDTDMAKEMVNYTKTNVLIQAGNAMLSQAMQQPQNILQLLS